MEAKSGGRKRRPRGEYKSKEEKEKDMETEEQTNAIISEEPCILEEINIEELAIDGICGVY